MHDTACQQPLVTCRSNISFLVHVEAMTSFAHTLHVSESSIGFFALHAAWPMRRVAMLCERPGACQAMQRESVLTQVQHIWCTYKQTAYHLSWAAMKGTLFCQCCCHCCCCSNHHYCNVLMETIVAIITLSTVLVVMYFTLRLATMQAAIHCGDSDSAGGPVRDSVRAWGADHHGWKKTQGSHASTGQSQSPAQLRFIHMHSYTLDASCSMGMMSSLKRYCMGSCVSSSSGIAPECALQCAWYGTYIPLSLQLPFNKLELLLLLLLLEQRGNLVNFISALTAEF